MRNQSFGNIFQRLRVRSRFLFSVHLIVHLCRAIFGNGSAIFVHVYRLDFFSVLQSVTKKHFFLLDYNARIQIFPLKIQSIHFIVFKGKIFAYAPHIKNTYAAPHSAENTVTANVRINRDQTIAGNIHFAGRYFALFVGRNKLNRPV